MKCRGNRESDYNDAEGNVSNLEWTVSDEMGEGAKRERVQCFIAGFTDQVFSYVSEREKWEWNSLPCRCRHHEKWAVITEWKLHKTPVSLHVGHTLPQRFLFGTDHNSSGAINSHPQKSNLFFLMFYFPLVKNQNHVKKSYPNENLNRKNHFSFIK